MKKKLVVNYRFLILILAIVSMLTLSLVLYNNVIYNNTGFLSNKNESSFNNFAFAQSVNKDIYNKDNIKSKELKQKVHLSKKTKKIENDKDFWDYLKTDYPNLYNSLNNLKSKYEKLYNHFLFKVYTIYQSMKRTENNVIKDLLKERMDIQYKIIKLVYDYKEKKIQENNFENQIKGLIKELYR